MKTLLAIMGHHAVSDQIQWSMPSYRLPGWDIIGIHPIDAPVNWPNGIKSFGLAKNSYVGPELILRWLKTIETCLMPEFKDYTDFCVIEYDCVFLRKPMIQCVDVVTLHTVGCMKYMALESNLGGFHAPWWMDRKSATIILEHGKGLFQKGRIERGSPDMFMGLILEQTKLPYHKPNTFCANGIDMNRPEIFEKAKKRVKEGAWMVHGIRTKEQLDILMELAK